MSERRRQHVWIVLPAFNEEESLPPLLDAIETAMFESRQDYGVVIVDDGSRDRTLEIARAAAKTMPITIEVHPQNLGLGATIRDGLTRAAALAYPSDVIVAMDADNSHSPHLVARMLQAVREGRDVVIASRYQPGSVVRGVPWFRRFISYWGSWLFRLLLPIPGVRDYTCGFRAYRAGLLQRTLASRGARFFDQEGFQAMVDILLKLRREPGVIFGEVPLVLRYDLKGGASKMRVWRTIRNTLALIARRRLAKG